MGLGGKCLRIIQGLYANQQRKMRTVAGFTDWIKCERGVKQGCVLSPLLFALYIAGVGKKLTDMEMGPNVGNQVIPGLFFADDIVIVAQSEAELSIKLAILKNEMEIRRLEINFDKTEIMKMGPGTGIEKEWTLETVGDQTVCKIQETNVYKYLGVRLGRSETFKQQQNQNILSLPRKMRLVKAFTRNAPDRLWAGEILWRKWAKPALLYAAEVIPMKKNWVNKLEVAQNKMGKWLLGTGPWIPTCRIRGELGWYSIQGEIYKKKLAFWGRILRMHSNRLPKKVVQQMIEGEFCSDWYEEVKEARREIGDIWDIVDKKNM